MRTPASAKASARLAEAPPARRYRRHLRIVRSELQPMHVKIEGDVGSALTGAVAAIA
jgi:hypothetical protein